MNNRQPYRSPGVVVLGVHSCTLSDMGNVVKASFKNLVVPREHLLTPVSRGRKKKNFNFTLGIWGIIRKLMIRRVE